MQCFGIAEVIHGTDGNRPQRERIWQVRYTTARRWVPLAIALVCQFALIPALPLEAQEPVSTTPVVRDVALKTPATLHGQVVDAAGQPLRSIPLWMQVGGRWLAIGSSDEFGRFRVSGLRGGVVVLATDRSQAAYRVWVPGTAPPGAAEQALLVSQGEVVRGQRPISELFFGDPLVVGLAVAAAVAVPIVVSNSKKSRAPGS